MNKIVASGIGAENGGVDLVGRFYGAANTHRAYTRST